MSRLLQRTIGNQATGRMLMRARATVQGRGRAVAIQRFGEMAALRGKGWKYSGGNIATNSQLDYLWHATVFKVDKSGKSAADGLFYNGFHLTMAYGPEVSRIEPHVFFDSAGKYDEKATLSHLQTKGYITAVGDEQWTFDLDTAKELSKAVLEKLGPIVTEEQREELEKERNAKKALEKEKVDQEALEAAKKKELEAQKAAAAADEATHINVLLSDAQFLGPSYKTQFTKYIDGDKTAIKDAKLKKVADWYLLMRTKEQWIVVEDPKAAYEDWLSKKPKRVTWPAYKNAVFRTWRAKSDMGLMSEYRMLKFTGYASYKLHPKAKTPPKV